MALLYAYGIIDSNCRIERLIQGVGKSGVYSIPYDDIGVVVSNIETEIKKVKPKVALEHERVVETLMKDFTILPIRFQTVFEKKDDVLHMMNSYHGEFKRNLTRLYDKVEFGIKAFWPGQLVRERIVEACDANHRAGSASSRCIGFIPLHTSGKSFLMKKFRIYEIEKEFGREADKYKETIDSYFSPIALEKKLKKLQTENLLLNASYLIKKEKQTLFKEVFYQLKSACAELKYLFSGPWPPYNFIQLTKKT